MPLEGHFSRVNTPLRQLTKRERNVVIAGLAVTVIALAALILATSRDSQPPPASGCIRVSVAGRTGAELIQACGMEARQLCARSVGVDEPQFRAIAAGCAAQDIRPLGSPPAPASPPAG
jgi:hypothetical protein